MRVFVTTLTVAFALKGSAFAGNLALSSLGATVTCDGNIMPCFLAPVGPKTFVPGNAIDGSSPFNATQWVAPSGEVDPTLLINLGVQALVDDISVFGNGNLGSDIQFAVYASATDSTEAALEGNPSDLVGVFVETVTGTGPGPGWEIDLPVAPETLQYVLYEVTCSNGNEAGCRGTGNTPIDDAYTTEITVDGTASVPEPSTLVLFGAGLLALGYKWRTRKAS